MSQLKSKNADSFPSFVSDFFNSDRFFTPGKWFDASIDEFMPAVNIKESDNKFSIELAVPGFKKEDFKINLNGDILNVNAEKKTETEDKNEKYTRKEYSYNAFSRSFSLPQVCNPDSIDAAYDNGILKIAVAKKAIESSQGKKMIEVK